MCLLYTLFGQITIPAGGISGGIPEGKDFIMSAEKRRKSNWYIYLIAFAVTMALVVMAVSTLWDKIMPSPSQSGVSSSGKTTYLPDASNNMMMLVMISDMRAGAPDYYLVVNYRPAEELIECIPFRTDTEASVGGTTGTLTDLYNSGGTETVLYAFEGLAGVKCDYYVKFDRTSFMDFIDEIGNVTVNAPYDIMDTGGNLAFTAGTHSLSGREAFNYLLYQSKTPGDDYQSVVLGGMATYIFNTSFRNLSSTLMQTYISKLINTADTNMALEDYTRRQKAFLYTSENSYNPAEYYLPYGEANENGRFVIAQNSISTIKERLGLEG